jgi:hypothetical protein
MLVYVSETEDGPKKIVPSVIWFESDHLPDEVAVNASKIDFSGGYEPLQTVPSGKIDFVDVGLLYGQPRKSDGNLIQARTQMVDNLTDENVHGLGRRGEQPDFGQFVASLRVCLYEKFGRIRLEEGRFLPLQIDQVILCPLNLAVRADERILRHGEEVSEQRN